MFRKFLVLCPLGLVMVLGLNAQTPIQVYGVWHCYTDGCGWLSVPDMTTFDTDNHWIIDRGKRFTIGECRGAELRESSGPDESHDQLDHHERRPHRNEHGGCKLLPE